MLLQQEFKKPAVLLEVQSSRTKPGAGVMKVFLVGSWMMVLLWLAVAFVIANYSVPWSLVILLSTVAFAIYLGIETVNQSRDKRRRFVLRIDETKVQLEMFLGRFRELKSLALEELTSAEVYRYEDDDTMVLRAGHEFLQIPLWAFGSQRGQIIRMLRPLVPMYFVP